VPASFQPILGRREELRKWLGLGDARHLDDPSLHDLLDLDEDCVDAELIARQTLSQSNTLGALEGSITGASDQGTKDFFIHLHRYVENAREFLGPKLPQYRRELLEYRKAKFTREILSSYPPSRRLVKEERKRLREEAKAMRLPKEAADEAIADHFSAYRVPEQYRLLVELLDLSVYPDDPTWPNHFDILGHPDGQVPAAGEVDRTRQEQASLVPATSIDADDNRRYEEIRQKIRMAAEVLRDPAKAGAHAADNRHYRNTKFEGRVKQHQRLRGEIAEEDRLALRARAAEMRVTPEDAERIIDGGRTKRLDFDPPSLDFGSVRRQAVSSRKVLVRLAGSASPDPVKCSLRIKDSWLSVTPAELSVTSEAAFEVRPVSSALVAGTHRSGIEVESSGRTYTVPVEITVSEAAKARPFLLRWVLPVAYCLALLGAGSISKIVVIALLIAGTAVSVWQAIRTRQRRFIGLAAAGLIIGLLPLALRAGAMRGRGPEDARPPDRHGVAAPAGKVLALNDGLVEVDLGTAGDVRLETPFTRGTELIATNRRHEEFRLVVVRASGPGRFWARRAAAGSPLPAVGDMVRLTGTAD
jgi:hypothetical protein